MTGAIAGSGFFELLQVCTCAMQHWLSFFSAAGVASCRVWWVLVSKLETGAECMEEEKEAFFLKQRLLLWRNGAP